jgi:Zn-finger nucleic acid-binding protein
MSDPATPPAPRPTGMPCPHCRVDLVMSERQGIEIDYCPQCRGVWLDRGELDKIIERSMSYDAGAPQGGPYPPGKPGAPPTPWGGRGYEDDDDDDRRYGRRRRGFLGGLFDD